MGADHPVTPDGRYFVAKGRLWRRTDPALDPATRRAAIRDLMRARRDVGRAGTPAAEREARDRVDAAKRRLGERGPVWWSDGAPDESRLAPWNSSYAAWWRTLPAEARGEAAAG